VPCVRAKSARVMRVVPSSSSLARAGGTERPPLLSWPAGDVLECLLPRANCVVPVRNDGDRGVRRVRRQPARSLSDNP